MMYALSPDGAKITAAPEADGCCPGCNETVVPHCGVLVRWHWAHQPHPECDPWWEPESAWHRWWKEQFPAEQVEVVKGRHRADIVALGTVIELQYGSLSPEEIAAREAFYGRMAWVFDARQFIENLNIRQRDDYVSFRWRWPRKSHGLCTRRLYWDFGAGPELDRLFGDYSTEWWQALIDSLPADWDVDDGLMLRVRRLHLTCPAGGWGKFGTRRQFLEHYTGDYTGAP